MPRQSKSTEKQSEASPWDTGIRRRINERLMEVADRYGVQLEKLRELSANMPSRPQFIVAVAKARLRSEATLLGEIIKRKGVEEALADLTKNLEERDDEAYTATPGFGH